ncbi:MAG: hypothetical protein LBR49_02935, partial [Tannerella sp.]|nr:hypothetical protein [Tannerella sp.]
MKKILLLLFVIQGIGLAAQNRVLSSSQQTLSNANVAQEAIRITHGPYLQNMSSEEVTVVWTTNKTAVSWVE